MVKYPIRILSVSVSFLIKGIVASLTFTVCNLVYILMPSYSNKSMGQMQHTHRYIYIYERESYEKFKSATKIQNTARLSCKVTTMTLMV